FADEETAQPLFTEVGLDRHGIAAFPRDCQRAGIEIRAKYLDRRLELVVRRLLEKQDGDSVGLLAGGTARHPYPQRCCNVFVIEEARDRLSRKRLECFAIAKEGGDRNEEIAEKMLSFIGILAQVVIIFLDPALLGDLHAPRDAPEYG